MPLLAGKLYDPATAGTAATTALTAMAALDTTNLRLVFTAPTNGIVLVRLGCTLLVGTTSPQVLLGVLEGTTVKGRRSPMGALRGTSIAATHLPIETSFLVTGLTGGASLTWDAAWATEQLVASTGLRWGGPNTNTTAGDAWGGFVFEIWTVT